MQNANRSPKPLLYIVQPEFKTKEFKMQEQYRFKIASSENEDVAVPKEEIQQLPLPSDESEIKSDLETGETVTQQELVSYLQEQENTPIELEEIKAVESSKESANQVPEEQQPKEISPALTEEIELPVAVSPMIETTIVAETGNKENPVEDNVKKLADPNLVQMFLKNLVPNADKELIKNLQEGKVEQPQPIEEDIVQEQTTSEQNENNEIKQLISKLARYPRFLEKPLCEAIVNGKKMTFKIESKRSDIVKVKVGNAFQNLNIDDIEQIKVL